ncbi:hypothetical protein [Geomonas anaerohicana]|uniref:Zinc ribbon domain-containing protein n=1 Tax=Geomonas anaerohicana TaxID=2798583 RepID=A0ABS0YE42_9BACT|nr:hypothetical protein [Geomonas anaerohicana]MBJ6750199.1 hypothetical protein [Geomonas anaerohicana]
MFEMQYNEEMEAEVRRLEAKKRAGEAGHPEWDNACASCGCQLAGTDDKFCEHCRRTAQP